MYGLYYKVNSEGKLEAVVGKVDKMVDDNGIIYTPCGSVIHIDDRVLNWEAENGLCKRVVHNDGIIHYIFKELCITRIRPNEAILLDTFPVKGISINNLYSGFEIHVKNTKSKGSKCIVCIKCPSVICKAYVKDENGNKKKGPDGKNLRKPELRENYKVSIITINKTVASSVREFVNFRNGKTINIYNYDGHHNGAGWDYRMCNTQKLTSSKHKEEHSGSEGKGKSHDLIVYINHPQQLDAFLKAIREGRI